jgi:hypothetical protein
MVPSRTQMTTNVGEDTEKGTLIHCWWEWKLVQPLWKTVWRFLKKLKVDLPFNPAILLLVISLKECESAYNKGIYMPLFITALLTISKLRKQPRCYTPDEWIKKLWYLYVMEFYSATKKNKILSFANKWMEL